MRSLRLLAGAAVLLAAAGCTDGGGDAAAGDPSPGATVAAPGSPAPPLDLAGPGEAQSLAALPTGPATGTAVVGWSGVGELRAPFTGECSRDGRTTRLVGAADTAQVRLEVGAEGATIAVDDVGFAATAALAAGSYEVSGRHLHLVAPMAQDGQQIGTLELEVDCG